MRGLAGVCLVACLGLARCFGGSPQPRYFALEPEPPAHAAGTPYPFTLLVRRFDTALAYDRVEIVYRPRPHEVRFYEYRLWIAKPGRMLSEVVAAHIDALGLFDAVTMRSTEQPAQYELRGEELAIDELDSSAVEPAPEGRGAEFWKARLAMKLVMSSLDTGKVVWEHEFDAVRDVERRDPRAVVAALAGILEDELGRAMRGLDRAFAGLTGTLPRLGAPATATP